MFFVDLFISPEHLFQMVDFRKYIFIRTMKLPIKILAKEPSPIIPKHNPIWIKHGYNLKNRIFPHKLRNGSTST
jgi:hypothetical protein